MKYYQINADMLGDEATVEDADLAAEWLTENGFPCENVGENHVENEGFEAPDERLWKKMLEALTR